MKKQNYEAPKCNKGEYLGNIGVGNYFLNKISWEPTEGVPVQAAAAGGSPVEAPSRGPTVHADHPAFPPRMS